MNLTSNSIIPHQDSIQYNWLKYSTFGKIIYNIRGPSLISFYACICFLYVSAAHHMIVF